jgi:hypothetical protein
LAFAPYWRATYEHDWGYNSASMGTSGMYVKSGLVPTYFSNSTDHLTQFQMTGEYYRDCTFGGLVSFVRTTGTADIFNGGTGSPTNQYETFELDYLPWFNVRFILQYNVYHIVNNNQNPLLSQ